MSHMTAGVPVPYGDGADGTKACEAKSSNLSCHGRDTGRGGIRRGMDAHRGNEGVGVRGSGGCGHAHST